jgi:predicted PurR-regulated permease PerM
VPRSNAAPTPFSRVVLVAASAVVVLAGMRAAAPVIGPAVIALLITIAWSPSASWLRRHGWHPTVAALAGIVLGVFCIALFGLLAWLSLVQLQTNLPGYQPRVEALRDTITHLLADLPFDTSRLTSGIALQPGAVVGYVVGGIRSITTMTGSMVLLLLIMAFMMLEGLKYPAKLRHAMALSDDTASTLDQFIQSMRSYVVINSVFGLVASVINTAILFALGVDYALLWGVASFLLGFLPNVGFMLALIPPALLALLEFGFARALVVVIAYSVVNLIVDSVIKPRLVGETLDLAPIVVVLSLVFWGWLLGPVGALLAVPLSVAARYLCEAFDEMRWLAHLMSDQGPHASRAEGG